MIPRKFDNQAETNKNVQWNDFCKLLIVSSFTRKRKVNLYFSDANAIIIKGFYQLCKWQRESKLGWEDGQKTEGSSTLGLDEVMFTNHKPVAEWPIRRKELPSRRRSIVRSSESLPEEW